MNNPNETPVEMRRRLQAMPGYRANALLDMVNRISYIAQGNISQYNSLVNSMQNPSIALPILDVNSPQKHDALLSEAERLLHNVVLAIKTRVDLIRVFMEKHFADDQNLTTAYQAEVTRVFAASNSAKFLEELRNHMTHHLLPVARSNITFTAAGPISFTLVLGARELLQWEWNARVRQWIEEQSPDVMIVDVVNEYGAQARSFDTWLMQQISTKYQQELSEFERATEAYNREITRIFGD